MCEHMDAEDVADTMNRVFVELTDIIEGHGGVVDKYLGDAVMALFGAPRAWGDDAERAARAGLAMIQCLDRLAVELEPRLGRRLAMRIGLNTGLVVAGMLGGRGNERYTVMGDGVNLASRMESSSVPGRLLASGNTLRFLAGRFAFEERGLITVKGKAEPVRAAFVLREVAASLDERSHSLEGVPIPFFGRETEIADLDALVRGALARTRGSSVVVHGPSGVGKSRIVEELARRFVAAGITVISAYDRAGSTEPLAGLIDALSLELGDDARSIAGILAVLGATPDDELALHVATLVERIMRRDRSIALERSTVLWGLAELLTAMAQRAPLVVVVEDACHGDRAFGALLETLRERSAPIVVLFDVETTGPGAQVVERLAALPDVVAYEVHPLSPEFVRCILGDLFANVEGIDAELIERCVSVSEGFPFFAIEYVRTLFALGGVSVNAADGRWTLVPSKLRADVLPASVQLAMQADIDHLPLVAREYVQLASIGDGSFRGDAVARLLEAEGFSVSAIADALRELVRRGLVHEIAGSEHELAFRSGQFHRAAYEGQLVRTRRDRHRRIAIAYEAIPGMADRPMATASQFLASDAPACAAPHLLVAFGAAIARYDLEGARAAEAQFAALAEAHSGALAGIDRAEFRSRSAQFAQMDGRIDEAVALATDFASEPVDATSGAEYARFHRARRVAFAAASRAMLVRGDFDASRAWGEQAWTSSLEEGVLPDSEAAVLDAIVSLAGVAHKQKRLDDALGLLADGRARAAQLEPWSDALALVMARFEDTEGLVFTARKSFEAALACFERSHRLRIGRGNPLVMSISKSNAAIAHHGLGRVEEAAKDFEDVLAIRRGLGDPERVALTLLNLAEVVVGLGRLDAAARHIAEVEAIIERLDLREYRRALEDVKGALDKARGTSAA
jgi:class 3 adenylate cyclase/tetratricopeptide (TPR) repeat protein